MSKKRKTKRNQTKNPSLHPELNPRIRYDLVDYDYLDKLSETELEWLNNFTAEYTHADFNHAGKQIHRTKKLKKDCYDRNNARNRCMWSLAKAAAMTTDENILNVADMKRTDDSLM